MTVTDNARRVCASKKVYKSRKDADFAIKAVWIMLGRNLGKYTCNVCHKYHLTSYQKTFGLPSHAAEPYGLSISEIVRRKSKLG